MYINNHEHRKGVEMECQTCRNGTVATHAHCDKHWSTLCDNERRAGRMGADKAVLDALKLCQVKIFMLDGSESEAYQAADEVINEVTDCVIHGRVGFGGDCPRC